MRARLPTRISALEPAVYELGSRRRPGSRVARASVGIPAGRATITSVDVMIALASSPRLNFKVPLERQVDSERAQLEVRGRGSSDPRHCATSSQKVTFVCTYNAR